ncbi:MAG: sugar ABC transporter permease [Planctomycetota bacterium]
MPTEQVEGMLTDAGGKPRDPIEQGTQSPRVSDTKRLATGLAFITPNILGFLAFTLLPLLFAMGLAFTNWDLRLHNDMRVEQFGEAPLKFVGLDNFRDLLFEPTLPGQPGMVFGLVDGWTWNNSFWKYLGNTLFFMMATPFAIGLSLLSAMLLSKDLSGGNARNKRRMLIGGAMVAGVLLMVGGTLTVMRLGSPMNGMILLFCAAAATIIVLGTTVGQTVYRTIFYLPHFVAGVATFLLWKKLFNPEYGPLTMALRPILDRMTAFINAAPWLPLTLMWVTLGLGAAISFFGFAKLRKDYVEGDLGWRSAIIPFGVMLLPALLIFSWYDPLAEGTAMAARVAVLLYMAAVFAALVHAIIYMAGGQEIACKSVEGGGSAFMFAAVMLVGQLVLIGLTATLLQLPSWAAEPAGLEPPKWLADVHWAKPSIMFMGMWAAIGGNTMLLYIAALTNVPQELYEASEIDGAGRFGKFWNVTWPQLAPTTFFIVVMAVIGGLQGGFEMARVMTGGGPAGQTTTVSYYIFQEGFETGKLAYSSAIAWFLFFLVFTVTVFNWRFGNRYVND